MLRNITTGTRVADRLDTRPQVWLQSDPSPFQNSGKNSYSNLRPRSSAVEKSTVQTSSAKQTRSGFLNLFGQGLFGRLSDSQPALRIQTLDRQASLNNTLDTAYRLGDLTGKTQLDWSDSVSRNNANDFFQFSLAKRTRVKFALDGLTAHATLRLFQGNGNASKPGSNTQTGSQSDRINRSLSAGTYYLQVAHNDSAEAHYTLTGQSSGRSPDAGDTPTKSLDAGLLNQTKRQYRAQLGRGDRADVYRFDLSSEATVNLSLSNTSSNAPALQLMDSTGAVIPASGSSSQSMRQKLIPGSYFVQVGTTSTGKTRYTLDLSASSNFTTSGINTTPPGSRPTPSRPPAPFGTNPFGWGNGSNNSGGGNSGNQNSGSGTWGGGAFGGGSGSSNWNTGRSLIRITKTNQTNSNGLVELEVAFVQGGNIVDRLTAVAGQPGKQAFRVGAQSRSGSMEPLPEGYWNLGTVEWASGRKGDFSRSWADANDGVGPVWVSMTPAFRTERSAIGFHFDNNADRGLPGTVGCVGITNRSELSRFVSWFDNATTAPKVAMVDWGLGTV